MKEKNRGEDRGNETAEAGVVSLSQAHSNMQEVKTERGKYGNAAKLGAKYFLPQ